MNPDHLIEVAQDILRTSGGPARQAQINRAISTAYYALFHAVCHFSVTRALRKPQGPRYWEVVVPALRAIDHGAARKTFARFAADSLSSEGLRAIGRSFVELQAARIVADYDPSPSNRATKQEALDLIDQARSAIAALPELPSDEGLLLSVHLITNKQR